MKHAHVAVMQGDFLNDIWVILFSLKMTHMPHYIKMLQTWLMDALILHLAAKSNINKMFLSDGK